ncbi:glutaredoxin domain-containing protein [Acidovorax sp. Root217]|uniref:glutaredoxin domain-containing protein n=1 Tax=Acidovorax sp. Root217 TaxID=1736492 RepID=UPI00070E5E0A|nr:glutaredoxin domain-containing protein [Acidovorax sp. Root217]KRC20806.1 NrdH-redoxin [Acidovorax sp. Root217]
MRKNLLSLPMLALLACTAAQAQTVYRIVGPDGKVTFSDRAPDNATKSTATTTNPATGAVGSTTGLPPELSRIAQRFPVTLYTGSDCAPCTSARSLLVNRGVPFTERTVSTNEDLDALRKLSGDTSLPYGTIGGQRMVGFQDTEWTQYLDVAGYPKASQLTASYRRPAATPLTAAAPAAAAPAAAASDVPAATASPRARPAPSTEGPSPTNPQGIRF